MFYDVLWCSMMFYVLRAFLVSFCRSVPPEFLRSFFLHVSNRQGYLKFHQPLPTNSFSYEGRLFNFGKCIVHAVEQICDQTNHVERSLSKRASSQYTRLSQAAEAVAGAPSPCPESQQASCKCHWGGRAAFRCQTLLRHQFAAWPQFATSDPVSKDWRWLAGPEICKKC